MRKEMLNEYPKMLYKFPSTTTEFAELQGGDKYDVLIVDSVKMEEDSLSDGWFLTSPEAKSGKVEIVTGPPTREELEQKATELKIKFSKKTDDAELERFIGMAVSWEAK